jgi:EAL domain-containing protein (putative c-di-GMP-specific phosphodiesterase class I)
VQAVVQRYSIRANRLKLELTESMLVAQIESVIETMKALREIGVRLSLDDFGTGYSSLQYLKLLPLNQVKIDQSFVRDLVEDSADRAIVRTIITMAESLKMDVIAEGVETNEQRDLLFAKGCSHYQGYLFGRPVLIEQFEALLQR